MKTTRLNTCNVLNLGTDTRRLWQFGIGNRNGALQNGQRGIAILRRGGNGLPLRAMAETHRAEALERHLTFVLAEKIQKPLVIGRFHVEELDQHHVVA